MIREAIATVASGRSLSLEDAAAVMREIMEGEATPSQLGAFLTALHIKGETPEEIAGMARVMREKALNVNVAGPLIDTCGTGGDGKNSFNISTAAAFVAAGAGLKVAKHGNRAASGSCGSADVLEALGIDQYLLVAEAFAAHAATTLQNARLRQTAQRYSTEIELIDEVSRILTSTLNLEEVYERFAQEVKKLVDFDRMNVYLINAADDILSSIFPAWSRPDAVAAIRGLWRAPRLNR